MTLGQTFLSSSSLLIVLVFGCAPDGSTEAVDQKTQNPTGSNSTTAETQSASAGNTADRQIGDPASWPGDPLLEGQPLSITPSGLRYALIREGEGEGPGSAMDHVQVHYTGWLTDGRKFDSSHDRGDPVTFACNGVIQGWTEGLQLMKPGSKYKFVIPGNLAYGPGGRPPLIGPNATLVFDVELIEVTRRVTLPEFQMPSDGDLIQGPVEGLRYQILKQGTGERTIRRNDQLMIHFSGWIDDGTLIDTSAGQPAPIPVTCGDLESAGFNILAAGCAIMHEGDLAQFVMPASLAFNRVPEAVSEDALVIYRVEIITVNAGPEALETPPFRLPTSEELVSTGTGLQYLTLREGTGAAPSSADHVTVHYAGWLTDGTLFDASYPRGQTVSFPLNGVIKGWTEGLQLMKEGGETIFVIPSDLGYGTRGSPPVIPGDATLVFHVALEKIGR